MAKTRTKYVCTNCGHHMNITPRDRFHATLDGKDANDAAAGHVRGYDTEAPGWGQTAEQAWGGVGEPAAQGILTRGFVAGGFVWTGFDYKGEPTPYAWPNINSHFGVIDIAGFPKDNYHYYRTVFFAADDEPIARLDLLDRRPWELSPDEFGEIARLVPDDMWAAMDAAGDALGSASDRAAP